MSYGSLFADLSGSASEPPAWMDWAVWPFLLLVAIFARPKGS